MAATQYAPPNLWDQTQEAKQNKLKGIASLRPVIQQADYAGLAQAYGDAGREGLVDAMDMYRQQAMGLSPSLANAQMAQAIAANNRQAMSMAGNARGGNLQGSFQSAMNAGSGANAFAAQQGAINRIAEQQAGMAGLAGLSGQLSQQGMGYAGINLQNALTQDQNALAWYSAQRGLDLQQRGQDRDFYGGLARAGIGAAGSALGAAAGI